MGFTRWAGFSAAALAGLWLYRRSQRDPQPQQGPPGRAKRPMTRMLGAGAAMMQDKSPLSVFNQYLNGFHFYADDMGRQMEAHHYCCDLNEDVTQCVIFDGNTPDARLIGIEYIISARLFETLPEEERRLWHSHHYEVAGGSLVAPGLPAAAEHRLMQRIINTYGKTWHVWDTMHDDLPLGAPHLMMGFTDDGQLRPELLHERDRRMDVSSDDRRRQRVGIPVPQPLPGANQWQTGRTVQLALREIEMPDLTGPKTGGRT